MTKSSNNNGFRATRFILNRAAISILLSLLPTFVFGDESTSVAVKALLENQVAAWNDGDIPTFMQGYWKSKKLTFSSGGKTTTGWKQTLERYQVKYDTPEKMGRLRFSHLEITELGEQACLVLGRWQLKRSTGNLQGNFSLVFRKLDGSWVIIHDHSSLLEKNGEPN